MRRLLALLALLSGLAAVGTPASAAVMSDVCEQVASTATAQTGKQSQCECDAKRRTSVGKAGTVRGSKARKPVTILIPTIQFGADRAYE